MERSGGVECEEGGDILVEKGVAERRYGMWNSQRVKSSWCFHAYMPVSFIQETPILQFLSYRKVICTTLEEKHKHQPSHKTFDLINTGFLPARHVRAMVTQTCISNQAMSAVT